MLRFSQINGMRGKVIKIDINSKKRHDHRRKMRVFGWDKKR